MLGINNNEEKYYLLYLKYKKKYLKLKMVGGTFQLPVELRKSEILSTLPILNNNKELSKVDFCYFENIFNEYLEANPSLNKLKNSIIGDELMGKYSDKGCLKSITHYTEDLVYKFYKITQKIDRDFYVFRSVNQSALTSNVLNNYIPFSTAYYLNSLFSLGTSFGGTNDEIVLLQIKINKDNIYMFIGGSENEITIQPGRIIIKTPYKYEFDGLTYIVYDCDFESYTEDVAFRLIEENKCK